MGVFNKKEKSVEEFRKRIATLPADKFLAVAAYLKVKLYHDLTDTDKKPMPRTGQSIIEDCFVAFYNLNRQERKALLKAIDKLK